MSNSDTRLEEIVREVMSNRKEILDKFCEAYIAENMKDYPIRNLVLNEQIIDNKFRWWFSIKDEEYMK